MRFPRSSGILLHPTSLPNLFGIGDLGKEAYEFIDFLFESGQKLWQVLPLGPPGYGDSPYNCYSAFAGNPLLISLEKLYQDGLLKSDPLSNPPKLPSEYVYYRLVEDYKTPLLKESYHIFKNNSSSKIKEEFNLFCKRNQDWLSDYALFMSLKEIYKNKCWNKWDIEIVKRKPSALKEVSKKHNDSINYHKYLQYQFFKQWNSLKRYALEKNIMIIGDIPIFVAYQSADVWSHPEMFHLDKNGNPTVVAGVPPDYFSETGQRWGNPLYRWEVLARDKYAWWKKRFKKTLELVDIVRIDHFRGFEAYWEIPANEKTAISGRWIKAPGASFFSSLEESLGRLPIIAEDLGVITKEVVELRNRFNFPGMKILQFAFSGEPDNPYLPHNLSPNCVIYTGTHDNDTTVGWFNNLNPKEKNYLLEYLGKEEVQEINWELIRLALSSVADICIFPLQDILGLESYARMNTPGTSLGNWRWRFKKEMLNINCKQKLKRLTQLYGR